MSKLTGLGLAAAMALALSFAGGSAQAFVAAPLGMSVDVDAAGSLVTPAAMCGRSCRGGGRYIPGPPSVCADEGLRYCGSSRGGGGGGGVGVVIPGTGIGISV